MSLYVFQLLQLLNPARQWCQLRLAVVADGGWWWWLLLALGISLGGCKSRWVPLSNTATSETSLVSRDTLVKVPALRYRHVFDTLPLHVPVFATDSSQNIALELTRRANGLEASVNVRERQVLVPRSSITRTDTVRIERIIGPPPETKSKWWQRLWPGALLGALVLMGLRLLLK